MHKKDLRDDISEKSLLLASEALDQLMSALQDASIKDLVSAYATASRVYKEIESTKPEVVSEPVSDPLSRYQGKLDEMVRKLASNNR